MKNKTFLFILVGNLIFSNSNAQNDPSLVEGSTGTVSGYYQGNEVTYTTVRGADGNIWLQQNIGSISVATSATDVSAYGHYFQWGRWDDGHQLPNSSLVQASTLNPNNPSGIEDTMDLFFIGNDPNDWWHGGTGADSWSGNTANSSNGKDVCTCLGAGWFLPSQSDWDQVLQLEGIFDVASGFASNLALPSSGSRDGITGILINVGVAGNYWTNSPSDQYAKNIAIGENYLNNNDDAYRYYGMNVRCMNTNCTGLLPPDFIIGEDTVCAETYYLYDVTSLSNVDSYNWSAIGAEIVTNDSNILIVSFEDTTAVISVSLTNECGTSYPTDLTIVINQNPQPTITFNENYLTTGIFASYQWQLNGIAIEGATDSSFTPTVSGLYTVEVVNINGCSNLSNEFEFNYSNLADQKIYSSVSFLQSESLNSFKISSPFKINIAIYSMDGKLILLKNSSQNLVIDELPSGIYFAHISEEGGQPLMVKKFIFLQ